MHTCVFSLFLSKYKYSMILYYITLLSMVSRNVVSNSKLRELVLVVASFPKLGGGTTRSLICYSYYVEHVISCYIKYKWLPLRLQRRRRGRLLARRPRQQLPANL